MLKANLLGPFRGAARLARKTLNGLMRPQRKLCVRFPNDAEVFAALRSDLPGIAEAQTAARFGDSARARRLLVAHFRERTVPRFFANRDEVRSSAEALSRDWPGWRTAALQMATDWQGLVYSSSDPSHRGADIPDWNNLPLGPGRDTVQQHRGHHFLFAVQLARAQAYGAHTKDTLRRLVDSWLVATDGISGAAAYSSPLVAVHRAVALTWTCAFLAGACDPDPELEFTFLRIILADARFVHARLGTSVPNNHLLADGFLMLYLGILYPELREAKQWRRDGESLFLRELRRQIYEDGTSFEHSVHYHEFVCEMVTAVVLLARRNAIELEPWVEERLVGMLRFQALLGGPSARSFAIGDGVETHLFPLDGFDGVGAASHREMLRALYDADMPASAGEAPGRERAAWMLAGRLADGVPAKSDVAPVQFQDGGFAMLPDEDLDGCLVFRTGPVAGHLCNPGHMHADLLSVFVRLGDAPIIIDPGTYTYRSRAERWPEGEPAWRAHFLGPAAHNGLCIEGHDPLDRGVGDFPSGSLKATVRTGPTVSGGGLVWTEASVVSETPYDGHVRGIVQVVGRYWLVYDLLPAAALAKQAWLSLHFSREVAVQRQGAQTVIATIGDSRLLVSASAQHAEMQILEGSRTPVAGWVSPRYGELANASVCRVLTTGGPAAAATLLQPMSASSETPQIEVKQSDNGALGIRVTRGREVDILLLSRSAAGRRVNLFDVDFEGAAVWLHAEDARPLEVRGHAITRAESKPIGLSIKSRRGPCDARVSFGRSTDSPHGGSAADLDWVLRRP